MTSSTALLHADTLAAYLKDRLPRRRTDALLRLAEVLLGILQAESTLHRKIALHLPRIASLDSKTRVVARSKPSHTISSPERSSTLAIE